MYIDPYFSTPRELREEMNRNRIANGAEPYPDSMPLSDGTFYSPISRDEPSEIVVVDE